MQLRTLNKNKGFTLVELMVSVSIFTVVMFISMGSILTVFDSSRKSQNLRAVMDNLNFTLEAMTRTIRFGKNYHCDASLGVLTSPRDCNFSAGASSFSVLDYLDRQVTYELESGRIVRSVSTINSGAPYYLTSSDVTIEEMKFYVFGSPLYAGGADLFQPQVTIVMSGYAGSKASTRSRFTLQTTVSQRMFDSQ